VSETETLGQHIGYHNHKGDADRRVCIDRMEWNEDGSLKPIVPTLEGPPPRPIRLALSMDGFGPYRVGSTVAFEAFAPHGDAFARLELWNHDQKVAENAEGNGRFVWLAEQPGFHRIWARATTAQGETFASSHFNIDVI
jgi:hypothetical protein